MYFLIIGGEEDQWRIYKSKMYTHAQCYNVVCYVTGRTRDYIFQKKKKEKCYFICMVLYCCCWAWAATAAAAARCCWTCWLTLSERRNIKICGSKRINQIDDILMLFKYLPGSWIIKWTQPSDCWTPRCRHSCSVNSRPFGTFLAISLGRITWRYSYIS